MKRPLALTLLALFDFAAALAALMWAGAAAVFLSGGGTWFAGVAGGFMGGAAFAGAGVLLWKMRPFGRLLHSLLALLAVPPSLFLFLMIWPVGLFALLMIAVGLLYLNRRGMRLFLSAGSPEELGEADAETVRKHTRGRSLPALAVVVLSGLGLAGMALLAAVAPINLRNMRDWDRTKVTMAGMRAMATAVETYYVDEEVYPAADSAQSLARILVPVYLKEMPAADGWGRPWRFQTWTQDPAAKGPDSYALASAGRDGIWEKGDLRDYPQGLTHSFDLDIVFSNGMFVQCIASHDHERDCE